MSTDIAMMLDDTDENFRKRFKKSPMKRAKRTGIARNIAIAMGNRRNASDTPVLERLAANDADPMVREAASWALEQFQSEAK